MRRDLLMPAWVLLAGSGGRCPYQTWRANPEESAASRRPQKGHRCGPSPVDHINGGRGLLEAACQLGEPVRLVASFHRRQQSTLLIQNVKPICPSPSVLFAVPGGDVGQVLPAVSGHLSPLSLTPVEV